MEIPETLREIVDRLGNALVEALANDEESRALVQEIQSQGFDMALLLEATVALRRRDEPASDFQMTQEYTLSESEGQWSDEDKAFLRTFKISL
jgi:uncharacterized protein (UPF0335 family)